MKIELNKTYRTRSGQKCRIICVDKKQDLERPIIGLILKDGTECAVGLAETGVLYYGVENDEDLICEWIDRPAIDWSTLPRWHKYAAMNMDGKWSSFATKPFIVDEYWTFHNAGWVTIPPEYAPKWKGDWKESLISKYESK